jgi:protocatechuate 3,4-dioxygenase beta subunit
MKTTRREFARGALGGLAGAVLVGGAACGGDEDGGGADAPPGTPDGGAPDAGALCQVYPEQTVGPYYLDLGMLRRDVTEGKPGAPLGVIVNVIRASDCAPLQGVAVDIWQCDADGVYSGFPGQLGGLDTTGMTFLRGTQVTDGQGQVRFDTIYPGWYPGRTTHIHFKVHPTKNTEAVSQFYFDEAITAQIYATAPYAARGPKDTPNSSDGPFNSGMNPPVVTPTAEPPAGWLAVFTVSVA